MWTRVFGGEDDDWGNSVQQTADSGFIIAGVSLSVRPAQVYLIKTDANGDTLWTSTFGGTNGGEGRAVEQTADSGYVIAGSIDASGPGNEDVYLIKTDANGDTLWTRTYGGDSADYAYSVQQTADGGYVVAGLTWSFGSGSDDVYLIKTDANGDTMWTRVFGGTDHEAGYSVQQTADSGFIIAGSTNSFGAGLADVYLIKTGLNGDTMWTRTFGGADDDYGDAVRQTSDSGYVIAGYTGSFGAGLDDVYIIKTDSLGAVAVAEPKANPPRAAVLSLSCEPNPFSTSTRMTFSTQSTSSEPPALRVYDAPGRLVRTFAGNREPCVVWDGRDDAGQLLPSGAYFVRCGTAGQHAAARLVLQR